MIDPRTLRTNLERAQRKGTRANPNPYQQAVPDLTTIIRGYVAEVTMRGRTGGKR